MHGYQPHHAQQAEVGPAVPWALGPGLRRVPDAFGGANWLAQRSAARGSWCRQEHKPEALQWRSGARQRASVYQPRVVAEAARMHYGGGGV